MNERKFDMNRDGLGLLLFALGLFPAVLIVKALLSTAPIETISGDGPIALSWIRALGAIPSLLFTGGILFLGGRLFLFGQRDNLVRDAIGIAGLTLASSILFGAFSATAGGNIGFATGGLVSSMTHVVVGVLFGLIAVALSIWFPWLREERAPRIATVPEDGAGAILDEEADTGVSAEEAAALIPEDFNRAIDEGRKQLAVKPLRSAPPPSPYPEDVRLKGQIPPGARPLNAEQNVRTEPESAPQPSSVYRWTAPRTDVSGDGADENLARLQEPEAVFAAEPIVAEETWSETTGIVDSPAADSFELEAGSIERELGELAPEIELSASSIDTADVAEIDPAANFSAEPLNALPRPSWEQSSLFTEADEPVDAYGTPLTLVEALRQDGGAGADSETETQTPESLDTVSALPTESDFAPELEAGSEDEPEFEQVRSASVRGAGVELAGEDLDDEKDFEDDDVLDEETAETEEEVDAFEDEDDAAEEEEEEEEAEEEEDEARIHGEDESEDGDLLGDEGDEAEETDDLEHEPLSIVGGEPERADETPALEHRERELAPSAATAASAAVDLPITPSAAPTTTSPVAVPTGAAVVLPIATAAALPTAAAVSRPTAAAVSRPTDAAVSRPTDAAVSRNGAADGPSRPPLEVAANGSNRRESAPVSTTPVPTDGPLVELMEQRAPARIEGAPKSSAAEKESEVIPSKPARRAPAAKHDGAQAKGGEREVILEPRAAPPEKTIKSQAVLPERAELLRDAGCLFVDRGRVAVSMLQRQYGMDFDQACEVLDELQNLGLIGPYLGGQRRDILLTREQWLEKVGSA